MSDPAREHGCTARNAHDCAKIDVGQAGLRLTERIRRDEPRDYQGDPDALVCKLPSQLLRKPHHGKLGGAVERHAGRRQDAAGGRDVHEMTLSLLHEVPPEGSAAVQDPPQVYVHHPLPLRGRRFEQRQCA
jgi:hypothetical protein